MGTRPSVKPVHKFINGRLYLFRSTWEWQFARFLEVCRNSGYITKWKYEPRRFVFPVTKGRKARSYLPDFEVWLTGQQQSVFYEIKGKLDPLSQARLKNMRQSKISK